MGLLSRPILKAPLTMRWANLHAEIMPRSHRSGEGLAMQGEVQLQQQIHPGSALAASQQADTKGYLEEKWVLCQSCMVRTGWLPNFPNSHSWVYPAKWNGYIQIILLIGTANFLVLLCCSPLSPPWIVVGGEHAAVASSGRLRLCSLWWFPHHGHCADHIHKWVARTYLLFGFISEAIHCFCYRLCFVSDVSAFNNCIAYLFGGTLM